MNRRQLLRTTALGGLGLLACPEKTSCMGAKPEPSGKNLIGHIFLIKREGLDMWKDVNSSDPLILRTDNRYGDEHIPIFNAGQPMDLASIPYGYQRYQMDEKGLVSITDAYKNAPYEAVIILQPRKHSEAVSFQGPIHWKNPSP